MKKFISIFLTVIMLMYGLVVRAAETPGISGRYAIVIDCDSGFVIYEKNADVPRAPASMTKVMSLYTFFRHMEEKGITTGTKVTISDSDAALSRKAGLSNVPLDAGEKLTVDTLLKACCVVSANAAMVALGSLVGGSEEGFVELMNEEAERLGLTAHFADASGLSGSNYITARSMAMLCRTVIREYPEILNYTSLRVFSFKGRTYTANNKVLEGYSTGYPGTDGMKTGYTTEAGYCISVTAKMNNRRLVAVMMGGPTLASRTADGYALLRYGFRNVEQAMEPITKITGTTVQSSGQVRVTLRNVPRTFEATVTWLVDGEAVLRSENVLIKEGTVLTAGLPSGKTELIISAGCQSVEINVKN